MAFDSFKNVFASDNGDLISKDDCRVIRPAYSYTFGKIATTLQLRATIRNGGFAWPGGYPLYLLFADGEPCCFKCAREDYKTISYDMHSEANHAQWAIVGCDINYEDKSLYCAHCNNQIESAYGDSDNQTEGE